MSSKGIGIPIMLLHEAEGHTVTVEMKTGETYRGQLLEAEDNWNCQVGEVTATAKDGKVRTVRFVKIRNTYFKNCGVFTFTQMQDANNPSHPKLEHSKPQSPCQGLALLS